MRWQGRKCGKWDNKLSMEWKSEHPLALALQFLVHLGLWCLPSVSRVLSCWKAGTATPCLCWVQRWAVCPHWGFSYSPPHHGERNRESWRLFILEVHLLRLCFTGSNKKFLLFLKSCLFLPHQLLVLGFLSLAASVTHWQIFSHNSWPVMSSDDPSCVSLFCLKAAHLSPLSIWMIVSHSLPTV